MSEGMGRDEGSAWADIYVRTPAAWQKVCQAVSRDEYVALVGPKYCGKTLLLLDVLDTLRTTGDRLPVYLDLEGWQVYRAEDLFREVAIAIRQAVPGSDVLDLPLTPEDLRDSQDFRYYLSALLSLVPNTIVLAVDHIESLPHYLAKALLRCFRVVYSERVSHPEYYRIVVVAAGALNLFELTTSLISPFNIATVVSIPDADEEQGHELIARVAEQLGVQFSPEAVGRILVAADGDRYLIQHLCRLAAARCGPASPMVRAPIVDQVLAGSGATDPARDPCVAERIQLVEADPDILRTVLEVLAGQEVKRRELLTDIDSAELTGVVKLVGHRYVMRSQVCERVLRRYFTPRRVARLFSAFGRWDEAIRYFEQSSPASSPAERAEYLAAVVNRIYGDGGEAEAFDGVAEALLRGFGIHQLIVYRYAEEEEHLMPAAWRGLPGYRGDRAIRLQERTEQPEAWTYTSDDYLLEKDGEGNSLFILPLPSGSRQPTVGVVTLYNHFPVERFAERQEEVLEITGFLAQAGRAIAGLRQKQELLRREKQRVQMLTGLGDVTKALTSLRDLQNLLRLIVDNAREVLAADVVTLYLYDYRERRFHTPLGTGLRDREAFRSGPLPTIEGQIAGWIVRERRERLFEDAAGHAAAQKVPFVGREAICSMAGFPLLCADEPVGVLFVGYRVPHSFSADERQIITAFVDQAAIAIENARLYQRQAEDHAILASLYQVSTRLRTSLDLTEVLEAITGGLQNLFDLATCTVGLLDGKEERLEFVAHLGLETPTARFVRDLPSRLWRLIREERERILVQDLAERPDLTRLLERRDLQSFVVLPLQGRTRFLGILTMGSAERLELDESDWELITALADQAAVAIENAQLHQEVRQAHQALDDSLKILTHQLRAAPAFVTNTLSILLAGKLGELDDKQRDRLVKAQRRLDQHHRLIDSLNMYGRLKGDRLLPRKRLVQLTQMMRSLAGGYRGRAARHGLTLDFALLPLPEVEVDEDMITIVVANLLDNALKFTPRGGSICLETWADDEGVHLAVDDTGPGIPPAERERVFLEYHQVESAHAEKGAGLGLYIAKRLVEMHDGRIAVVAKSGSGTRVVVTLPA
jgi:signal transduction histidine kinase